MSYDMDTAQETLAEWDNEPDRADEAGKRTADGVLYPGRFCWIRENHCKGKNKGKRHQKAKKFLKALRL